MTKYLALRFRAIVNKNGNSIIGGTLVSHPEYHNRFVIYSSEFSECNSNSLS